MLPTDFHVVPSSEFSPPLVSRSYSEARHLLRLLVRVARLAADHRPGHPGIDPFAVRGVRGLRHRASRAQSLRRLRRPTRRPRGAHR